MKNRLRFSVVLLAVLLVQAGMNQEDFKGRLKRILWRNR